MDEKWKGLNTEDRRGMKNKGTEHRKQMKTRKEGRREGMKEGRKEGRNKKSAGQQVGTVISYFSSVKTSHSDFQKLAHVRACSSENIS